MNRRIRRLSLAVLVLYVALFVKLNQIQLVDAGRLNDRSDNTRAATRDFNSPRGTIASADGTILARSLETGEESIRYRREYPTGDLFAHVVGTFTFQFGAEGVERRYNDQLSGRTSELEFPGLSALWDDTPNVGDLTLTLREDVQRVAKEQLGDRRGSVVALDPRSGAVLALWTYPAYDPNLLVEGSAEEIRTLREFLDLLPEKPRLAKAYQEVYFPGSTFKVVTAAAGLESGKVTVDSPSYPVERSYTPPLTTRPLSNFDRSSCGGTLYEILRVSCNTAFARMAAETLGPEPMVDMAQSMGFGERPPLDLPGVAASRFPTDYGERRRAGANPGDADIFDDTPKLAQAALGQNDVAASPLQMALVAAAVANRGDIMTPHVLDRVTDARGRVVFEYDPAVWRTATSPETAATLREGMLGVVERGTASAMAIPGMEVGGKTGTAQLGTTPARSHAWVIGFAGPPGQPAEVAVAVLVEGQPGASEQTGGRVSAPIARAVMETALRR